MKTESFPVQKQCTSFFRGYRNTSTRKDEVTCAHKSKHIGRKNHHQSQPNSPLLQVGFSETSTPYRQHFLTKAFTGNKHQKILYFFSRLGVKSTSYFFFYLHTYKALLIFTSSEKRCLGLIIYVF